MTDPLVPRGGAVELTSARYDLAARSLGVLLVVVFPKSRARSYPVAVTVASNAAFFETGKLEGTTVHVAAFAKTAEDAARALSVMDSLQGIKGVQYWAQGNSLGSTRRLRNVIECYMASHRVEDPRYYCRSSVTVDEGGTPTFTINMLELMGFARNRRAERRGQVPCRLVSIYSLGAVRSKSAWRSMVQSAAVEKNCDACPRFDIDAAIIVERGQDLIDGL